MKFNKLIPFFAIIFVLTATSFSTDTLAQIVEDEPYDLMSLTAGNSVEGFWQLNIDESDDPKRIIQTLIQKSNKFSDKDILEEQNEPPGISISILPPERLVLAGGEDEFTINEFYPDHIFTRTFPTDGLPHIYQSNNGGGMVVNASGEKSKLSIDTLSPRGNNMTETFELSADASKLKITIQISDSNLQELLTLQRIYDRAISDDLSEYN